MRLKRLFKGGCFDSRILGSRTWKAFTNVNINCSNKHYIKVETTNVVAINIYDSYFFASIFSTVELFTLNNGWRAFIINTFVCLITSRTYYSHY